MDPNAALEEIRELSTRMADTAAVRYTLGDAQDQQDVADPVDVARLAELILGLDGWLAKGGPLPRRWGKRRA